MLVKLWVIVFLLSLFPLGGCSIPRAAELRFLAQESGPIPRNTKLKSISVSTMLAEHEPTAMVQMASTQEPKDLMAFFTTELRRRGWHVSGEVTKSMEYQNSERTNCAFVRGDTFLNVDIYSPSHYPDDAGKTAVELTIGTNHLWDFPSRFMQYMLVVIVGDGPIGRVIWNIP